MTSQSSPISLHQHPLHSVCVCVLHRGRGEAWPPLCPLLVFVPPVGGDGNVRPGAGQQHLQETLSGEVSLHSQHFWLWTFCLQQVVLKGLSTCRPFRPSLSSFSRMNSSLKPVQVLTVFGDNLLQDITLVGGNQSGIFVSTVKSGSLAEKAGLREGHHLLLVGCLRSALVIRLKQTKKGLWRLDF